MKRTSRVRRSLGCLIFQIIPMLLVVAIIWSGYQVAQGVLRQFDERNDIEGRRTTFFGTATSIALLAPTATETPTITHTPTDTPEPTATDTPNNTPQPTATDVPSDTPTSTATAIPSETPLPPSNTPTATAVPAEGADEDEATALVLAQFNATNTPRPVIFATNTPLPPDGVDALPTPTEATATPTETDVPQPTAPPTPIDPPAPPTEAIPAVTEAPEVQVEAARPLPTVFLPRTAEEGITMSGTAVPTSVPLVPRDGRDLVNILLLGGDDELTSDGFPRMDTMIVVSINRDTNTVSMLSLPRDLFVYIPTPNGMMQRLNVTYAIGESIGYTDGGFGLMRQTLLYNLGINVHYYARVDFDGFRQIVDTLGGVEIAVDCAYQDYPLIGAEVPDGAVMADDEGLRTLNVGYYHMDGAQALWYARTRRNSSDFDRGRRQQQLLRAIWRTSLNTVSLTNAPQLWNQGLAMLETDMTLADVVGLMPIALDLDVSRIRSYTLIRIYHTEPWQTPDGDFVQLPVYETMRPLVEDFYSPPTNSQLLIEEATIAVYNGTANADWDRVAAERLAWEGFRSSAVGQAETTDYAETMLIDFSGQQKRGSLSEIARVLNVRPENIRIEPDPNRTSDFTVILGANYNSCNVGGVLAVD